MLLTYFFRRPSSPGKLAFFRSRTKGEKKGGKYKKGRALMKYLFSNCYKCKKEQKQYFSVGIDSKIIFKLENGC